MKKSNAEVIKQPVEVVIITFLALLGVALARAVVAPYPHELSNLDFSPLATLIDGWFTGHIAWAAAVSTLLAVTNAVLITRIITRYSVAVVKTLIPAVLFAILSCSLFFVVRNPSVGLMIFAFTRAAELMVGSFRRGASYENVAESAFCLGLAVLLYPAAAMFLLVAPLILLIYKRSAREIAAAALFVVTPTALASFGWWFAGADFFYVVRSLADGFVRSTAGVDWSFLLDGTLNIVAIAVSGLAGLIVVASIAVLFVGFADMRQRLRNINLHFLLLMLCTLAMMLLGGNPSVTIPLLGVCCVPLLNNIFVRYPSVAGIVIYVVLTLGSLAAMVVQLL